MIGKILLCSIVIASYMNADEGTQTEGIKYIKMLGKTLKSNLQKEMESDKSGVGAMYFCTKEAEVLTKEVNSKLPEGTIVRRTSLRYRNEANKPDITDVEIMERILRDMNASKKNLDKPFVVDTNNSTRIYKALFVEPVCLKCHGEAKNIPPKIVEAIRSEYPRDLAVGFREGDLRGVIVLEMEK